jgi:hypothetical protein
MIATLIYHSELDLSWRSECGTLRKVSDVPTADVCVARAMAEHADATGLHRTTVSVGLVGALFEVVQREYQ